MDYTCKLSPAVFEAAWKNVETMCATAARNYESVVDTVEEDPLREWARSRLDAIRLVGDRAGREAVRDGVSNIARDVMQQVSEASFKQGYKPLPACAGIRQFCNWESDTPVKTQARALACVLYRSGVAVAARGYIPGSPGAEEATMSAVIDALRDDAPFGPVPALMAQTSAAAVLAEPDSGIYLATARLVEDGRFAYAFRGESWECGEFGIWQQEDEWMSASVGDAFRFLEDTAPLGRPGSFAPPTACIRIPLDLALEAIGSHGEPGAANIARVLDYLPRDQFEDPCELAPWGIEEEVRRAFAQEERVGEAAETFAPAAPERCGRER